MHTVILDFGNVVGLFDHGRTLARLAPFTDMAADEIFLDIYQGALEEEFETGRIGEGEFLRVFRERCRITCDSAFLAAAIADIFEPNPEVCGLIPQLMKRYRLLLGSNTNIIHSRHFRQQFADILNHFDALVLSHEIGDRKPRPGFYNECLRRAQCPPDECLFIDDIAANVAGAKACGMQGLVYDQSDRLATRLQALNVFV